MRDHPFFVGRIPEESAEEVVVNTPFCHCIKSIGNTLGYQPVVRKKIVVDQKFES